MLTVLTWFSARRERKSLRAAVLPVLPTRPTLLCVVSDEFRQESHLRPFGPLAEALESRMDFVVAAEWPQVEREREGSVLLRELGLVQWAWPRLLVDRGALRGAVVLRERRPVALIDLFFDEKDRLDGDEAREAELRTAERELEGELDRLLVRLQGSPQLRRPARGSGPSQERAAAESLVGAELTNLATRVERMEPREERMGISPARSSWDPPREEEEQVSRPRAGPGLSVHIVSRLVPRPGARTSGQRPGVQVVSVQTTRTSVERGERDAAPTGSNALATTPQPQAALAQKPEPEKRWDRFQLIELD